MKNKVPRDLYPSKAKNFFVQSVKKNNLKKNFF